MIFNMSVATLAVLMNRAIPSSPPSLSAHRSPITRNRALNRPTSPSSDAFKNWCPSCTPQMSRCDLLAKQSRRGVLAPTPRGSNPSTSNLSPTTVAMSFPLRAIRSVPDPPGPPGLTSTVPR